MADVMEERVRSIELCAGLGFSVGALILSTSLVLYPKLAPANQTNLILEAISKQDITSWMGLHAMMVVGFLLSTVAFTAFGFLLHLRGSSGPAAVVTASALLGGSIWATFLSLEFFVGPFLKSLYPVDPGLATMLFNTVWFWKMGALALGGVLLFTSVIAAGISGTSREILPVWLGWGGAFFGVVGVLIYAFEFWSASAIGSAINPMRNSGVRFGVGLPLQLWMMGVGVSLLNAYRNHSLGQPRRTSARIESAPEPSKATKPRREPFPQFPEAPPLPPPIP